MFIILLLGVATVVSLQAEELVLVEQGISKAPIIVYEGAQPRTRHSADELADYMEKISGARPEIIEGEPQPLPERAIWVGYQPALKKLFPKLDFDFKHSEEILLAANANHLVLAGRDRWDPDHMQSFGRLAPIIDRQQEYGTINAVYTFLQDYLHVRWLWPGEIGEDILPQKTIAFPPFEFRYHPQIRARIRMFRLGLGNTRDAPDHQWARFQRLELDSLILAGGHAFNTWWDKYHEDHPDYFALQPDGTRSGWPAAKTVKLCQTNPAVWDQWLEEVEEQLAADPTIQVFNASPNDGWPNGHCVCENCRAWDHPDGELFTWRWGSGMTNDWPAITDRHVTFANKLARKLKKRFPDKELFVQLHAYGMARPAPIVAVPDDNVIISSVANFFMRGDGVQDQRTKCRQEFKGWAAKAPHLAWRPNLGNPVGQKWGMPDVAMTQAAEDFRFVAENNCIGLFFDMLWGHWAAMAPQYYLIAKLAWNPYADAQAIMDDYYERGFGKAAGEIRVYWELMEVKRNTMVKEVPNKWRAFDIPQYYTPEFLDKAEALLDAALVKVKDEPEVYRQRIEFLKFGLEHTRVVVDTRKWMQQVEESKGKDAEAAAKVLACWEKAAQMKERMPPYAIGYQTIFNKPMNKSMFGMHPDNALEGRKRKEYEARDFE